MNGCSRFLGRSLLPCLANTLPFKLPMPNYLYTDESGQKYTLTEQRLQTLIDRGVITPTTPLETDTGHHGLAGQIPGLNFDNVAPPPSARTSEQAYYSPPRYSAAYSQPSENSTGGSILAWLFDCTFQNIRIREFNIRACRIIYTICLIQTILVLIVGTLGMLGQIGWGAEFLILALIGIPCLWITAYLYLFIVRIICEWSIILLDWVSEVTKAARKYNDE